MRSCVLVRASCNGIQVHYVCKHVIDHVTVLQCYSIILIYEYIMLHVEC